MSDSRWAVRSARAARPSGSGTVSPTARTFVAGDRVRKDEWVRGVTLGDTSSLSGQCDPPRHPEIRMKADTESVYAAERDLLVAQLRDPTTPQWTTPSMCDGSTRRDVTAHLLMPYDLSLPRFLAGVMRARFGFDRFADRWARADSRTGPQPVDALAATDAGGCIVPGASECATEPPVPTCLGHT
jgi:hypothetical protein